jgi:hypothetical protein
MQDNFIEIYNVFSPEFCKDAIKIFYEASEHGFMERRGGMKHEVEDEATHVPVYGVPMKHSTRDLFNEFNKGLDIGVGTYYNKYSAMNNIDKLYNYKGKIQKSTPGMGYHAWHCEAADEDSAERQLTWTVYLNEEFEAGETEFLYQQYRYKPKTGDLLIFPAAFTHTHRGNPPINGTKYIITGWLEF